MPLVKRIHAHTARLANASIPGSSMVDLFPFLNHLPLWMSAWKSDALAWHKRESEMFESFNAEVEKKMVISSVTWALQAKINWNLHNLHHLENWRCEALFCVRSDRKRREI